MLKAQMSQTEDAFCMGEIQIDTRTKVPDKNY